MTATTRPPQVFHFGVFELDGRARELRKQGVRVRLQEQPFLVLAYLLERAGEVVTRDELRQTLWPASVYVDFDHGLNNAIARVRDVLGDSAATPHYIETLPRLGYRFVFPVERPSSPVASTTGDAPVSDVSAPIAALPPPVARRPSLRTAVAAAVFVVLLGVLPGLWLAQRPSVGAARTPVAESPSVAVLPFVNLSSDPENQFVADGLSEELLHTLAGIRGLKVAARTTSAAFKDTRDPPDVIARKLNVDHLLEGSVRSSGQRLRITAQLIDAVSGYHLWSQVYDRETTDIFQVQEEIARAVAASLQVTLVAADEARLGKRLTADAEAYRLYLVARARIAWVFGRPDWAAIKQSYEAAIARDPGFAAAHAGLAHYYFNRATNDEDRRLGEAAAARAVELDPELSEALSARANWEARRYLSEGDYQAYGRAVQDYRRALELDPVNGQATFHFARAVVWTEPALADQLFERTLELDPMRFSAAGFGAFLESRRGEHEAARRELLELYRQNPDKGFHIAIFLATLAADLGRLDEAVAYQREAQGRGDVGATTLWTLHMSLGDQAAATALLDGGAIGPLDAAARSVMDGQYDRALASLERARAAAPNDRDLDVALARLALIAGHTERARSILERRLPHVAAGTEPIDGRNVLPALDLAATWLWTNHERAGAELLKRCRAFLDGPSAPHWPRYAFLRARAYALAGEPELAQRALDRAYAEGFRTTWGVDVAPRPFGYIDPVEADPAFAGLRTTVAYQAWFERTRTDNARQLARLKMQTGTNAPRVAAVEGAG